MNKKLEKLIGKYAKVGPHLMKLDVYQQEENYIVGHAYYFDSIKRFIPCIGGEKDVNQFGIYGGPGDWNYVIPKHTNKFMVDKYHIDYIYKQIDNSLSRMLSELNDDDLNMMDIKLERAGYKDMPKIFGAENILTKMTKMAVIKKGLSLRTYKKIYENDLNRPGNLSGTIDNYTKYVFGNNPDKPVTLLALEKFWSYIGDLDIEIIIRDKENSRAPMNCVISSKNVDDMIEEYFQDIEDKSSFNEFD